VLLPEEDMPRAVQLNPQGRLAQALAERMNELDVTIRQLAEGTGLTYEHIRKLVKGEASPSKLALQEVCRALELPPEKMQELVVADHIERKYGGIPHALAGKHPELSLLAPWWDLLTEEQKAAFRVQIRSVAEANQGGGAPRKPARGAAPEPGKHSETA
jgi:transcriptional regulator with XRE-family HTH domain